MSNSIPKFENFNGRLDRMSFISGIEFLSTFYSTFKFWNEDFNGQVELRKQIWYEMFADFEGFIFQQLVHAYCKENIFAPQSPTQLLDYGKKKLMGVRPTAEEAYLVVQDIVRKNGQYIISTDNDIEKLEDETTKKAYKQTRGLFHQAWHNTYHEPECMRKFVNVYNGLLETEITNDKVIDLLNLTKGSALFIKNKSKEIEALKKENVVKELT